MEIQITNIGKRFGRIWIFKEINHAFHVGKPCAVVGANGSGKSTFLKIVSGGLTSTFGKVKFIEKGKEIYWSDAAQYVNYAAPYMDLIEHLTLKEHVNFHFKFKQYRNSWNYERMVNAIEMNEHQNKLVKDFSSGMKQRLKLAFALYTENPIVLLDEPTANLDVKWSDWYLNEIKQLYPTKIVVIASNQKSEYDFCEEVLKIQSYQ